ncbi:phasin family protein [Mesorhizobium sp. ORM8.1]
MTWKAEEFSAPNLPPLAKTGQKLLHAAAALQMDSTCALFSLQMEGASFLSRRFWDDLRLIEMLMRRDELVDTYDVFVNFFQNATSDYTSEVARFASLGAEFASETAGRVREEAEATIDDMRAATLAP